MVTNQSGIIVFLSLHECNFPGSGPTAVQSEHCLLAAFASPTNAQVVSFGEQTITSSVNMILKYISSEHH